MVDAFLQKIPKECLQLLSEIACVGISKGKLNEGNAILGAVVAACPGDVHAKLLQGIGFIYSGYMSRGFKTLISVLKENPKNEYAKIFMSFGLKALNMNEQAIAAAKSTLKASQNPAIKQFAECILGTCETVMSPMDLQKQQASIYSNTK